MGGAVLGEGKGRSKAVHLGDLGSIFYSLTILGTGE